MKVNNMEVEIQSQIFVSKDLGAPVVALKCFFSIFLIFRSESLKTTVTLMMDTRSNANYKLTDANLHDGKILSMFLYAICHEQ